MDTETASDLSLCLLILGLAAGLLSFGFLVAHLKKSSLMIRQGLMGSSVILVLVLVAFGTPILAFAYTSPEVVYSREPLHISPSGLFYDLNNTIAKDIAGKVPETKLVGYDPIQSKTAPKKGMKSKAFSSPGAKALRFLLHGDISELPNCYAAYYKKPNFQAERLAYHKAFDRKFEIDPSITKKAQDFIPPDTIGVHLRYTGHFFEKDMVPLEEHVAIFIREIKKHNFSKIFVATMLVDALDLIRKEFGAKRVISYKQDRLRGNIDWTQGNKKDSIERSDAVMDWLLLSNCKAVIGAPSNVFFAVLWKNPSIEFFIPREFQSSKAK